MDSDVLVVDDSAAIRKILQRVLRQTGMAIGNIHEAGDGQEALAVMAQHPVSLVLSDINMPRMDGLQLLASLNYQSVSGEPYQRTVSLAGGTQVPSIVLPVEPLGARRMPAVNLMDVRIQKTVRPRILSGGSLALRIDCFNALNANTVTGVTTQSGTSFEVPTTIVPPRIISMGATFSF